jgi:hypothetical protein
MTDQKEKTGAPSDAPASAPDRTPVDAETSISTPAPINEDPSKDTQDQPSSSVSARAESAVETTPAENEQPPSQPPSGILPATHWAQLPLVAEEPHDDDPGDDESAFVDVASSTASLADSILEYRNIHGRTFHSNMGVAESWYAPCPGGGHSLRLTGLIGRVPNDEQQKESMDIQ